MDKTTRLSVLLVVLLGAGFVSLDVVAHRLTPGTPQLDLPHFILAASVLLISFVVMRQAVETHLRGEIAARQAQAEAEARAREREAELERTNLARLLAEREQAQAGIERLASFPQFNPNPVLEIDAEGEIAFCNPGATRTLERLGLQDDARAFFPDDLAAILQELGQKRESEFRREVRVGSAVFSETVHVIPTFNVVRIYAYDVSERRHMEDALRQSEERFRLALKNAPVTVAAQDKALRFTWAYNQRTVRPTDVLGRTDTDLFPPDSASQLIALKRQVLKTGSEVKQQMWVVSGNSRMYLDIYLEPIRNESGEIVGVGIATVDLTERKLAEEALQKQARILSRLHDAVMVTDKDYRITFWNTGAERIYGYRAEEVLGQTPDFFPRPSYLDTTREEVLRRLMREGGVDGESARITKDGRNIQVESHVITVRNDLGEPSEFIWVDRDITARREAEEALRHAQAELARGIKERATLEERQRLARELHDSVSQALYGISLGVHGALTVLDTDRDKARHALNYTLPVIEAGITEMRALLFELRPESLETEGLVAGLTKRTAAIRAREGIEVELSMCDEPDIPIAAKEALYRIAQEALQNAIKHAQSTRLEVRLNCTPDGCLLEVCDNGVGFDPQVAVPGHLGLLSMRERAANAGGTLAIESGPDRGTRVRAVVPFCP